jgi:hypothetical protein
MVKLFNADGFMIRDSFFVAIIDALEAIKADAAVEVALLVDSDELVGTAVLVAVIHPQIHG